MTPAARRRGAGLVWLVSLALTGCVPLPSAPGVASVAIRNHHANAVTVRWVGPDRQGDVVVDACDTFELDVTAGQYTFDVRSRVDQVSLPVVVDASDVGVATVIGITPAGDIGFGAPPPNPSCANN